MEQYLWILKDKELGLLRELEVDRLARLDEDDLLALHKRIRHARNKHMLNYRRRAAKNVVAAGGRGAAAPVSEKARGRAIVFEEALSLVSAELARVAHESAEALRAERLARVQESKWSGPTVTGYPEVAHTVGRRRVHTKTAGGLKRDGAESAQVRHQQAKRDSR